MANLPGDVHIAVIGAGQAGLSAAYHLQRLGADFVVLDGAPGAGGAWQHRWPSLTLSTVNRIHDLPGLAFADAVPNLSAEVQARSAVPAYFAAYEQHYELPVVRPVRVHAVREYGEQFLIETDRGNIVANGVISATGTWETPRIPEIPGAESFLGEQVHTKDYHRAEDFASKHVIVVGAGISAIQLLDEVSQVTTTTWVTRRKPDFLEGPFDENAGRRAVALVDERVRQGLEPLSVVSVTGLPMNAQIRAMQARGVLERKLMFTSIEPHGVRYPDDTFEAADVIFLEHRVPGLVRSLNTVTAAQPTRWHCDGWAACHQGGEQPADPSGWLWPIGLYRRCKPGGRGSGAGVACRIVYAFYAASRVAPHNARYCAFSQNPVSYHSLQILLLHLGIIQLEITSRKWTREESTYMTTQTAPIDASTTVNDLLKLVPAASGLLSDRGLDTCCGGSLTLEESCEDAGVELGSLLTEITALQGAQ